MTKSLSRQPINRVPGYQSLPGSTWIDNNRATLPDNQWVAAGDSGFLAANSSIDKLMDSLRDAHVNLERVAIAFISSDSV